MLSLVATQISYSDNYLYRMDQFYWSYSSPFIKGGGGYLSGLCISRTLSAHWRIHTLKGFIIPLFIYLTWSWNIGWCFLHMLFSNSNHNFFSNYSQCSAPLTESPVPPCLSTLDQVQNCSAVKLFYDPIIHWYPDNPFAGSLHSNRTCQTFFRAGPLRIRSVYLIIRSKSNLVVISRCSNTPTVSLVMTCPSW